MLSEVCPSHLRVVMVAPPEVARNAESAQSTGRARRGWEKEAPPEVRGTGAHSKGEGTRPPLGLL